MEQDNITLVKEFILLAFPNLHQFQLLLFIIVLLMYITCVFGYMTIISLIMWDSCLHGPMYFFISNFAFVEIIYVSIIIPPFLHILVATNNRISHVGCFAQMYTANTMGLVECFLLVVMAFDRDLAINNPFHYFNIMSRLKKKLAINSWIAGFVFAFIPAIFTASLKFCDHTKIDHFFCDLTPLQNLACSDSFVSRLATNSVALVAVMFPFLIIIGFYLHIIVTISKIKSVKGKQKAFSTCSSHLIVASLFFFTTIVVYGRPYRSQYDKFLALIYTIVTPLLNPFIYVLRNRDVKSGFFKLIAYVNPMTKKSINNLKHVT